MRNVFQSLSAAALTSSLILAISPVSVQAQTLNRAPNCQQAMASPEKLWPVNHKLIPIDIQGVTDPEQQPLQLETQCIVQDETVTGNGDGNTDFDGTGLTTSTPSVRAERSGRGNGRVYHIVFKATDSDGAQCAGQIQVNVPHSNKKNATAIDDGHRYPSTTGGVNCDALTINNPPIIYSTAVLEGQALVGYQYDVQGHDPDADTLTYALIQAPEGMSINNESGLIGWTPSAKQSGQYQINIRVSDTGGLLAEQTFELDIASAQDQLAVKIVANPVSGSSPLKVRFSPDVQNHNLVINTYRWDFTNDGSYDASDTFGAPRTYTYSGEPGTIFVAKLTIYPAGGEPLSATQTITIENEPPTVQVRASQSNGHVPLPVTFTVQAQDPQGIARVQIDYDSDGQYDETQTGSATSGTWSFQTTYSEQGNYQATVLVEDRFGAQTVLKHNAINVDVNDPLDPIIQLSASPASGAVPLTTTLSATAELFDGSTITTWSWDLDGDGQFETTGGSGLTDNITTTYASVNYFYPVAEVTTSTGRKTTASVEVVTQSSSKPTLSIPNSTDTINTDNNQSATINVSLPYETELSVWIENSRSEKIKTLQIPQLTSAGQPAFQWDGRDENNDVVDEGDYYAVISYTHLGATKELDLRTSTGGQLSYYRRTTSNPRTFDRLESPLRIDFAVDDPAEVTFFWQVSFGQRLMTLLEHERMGRGQYSLYWNGEYPDGVKLPDGTNRLMPGIVRYKLPENVIFVRSMPRIEQYKLHSTMQTDPRREPVGMDLTLSKAGTVELVVADMTMGVDVAHRIFADLPGGESILYWDGKNDQDQLLFPGDYRMGVRSADDKGNRSLFWYRTQRIDY